MWRFQLPVKAAQHCCSLLLLSAEKVSVFFWNNHKNYSQWYEDKLCLLLWVTFIILVLMWSQSGNIHTFQTSHQLRLHIMSSLSKDIGFNLRHRLNIQQGSLIFSYKHCITETAHLLKCKTSSSIWREEKFGHPLFPSVLFWFFCSCCRHHDPNMSRCIRPSLCEKTIQIFAISRRQQARSCTQHSPHNNKMNIWFGFAQQLPVSCNTPKNKAVLLLPMDS